MIDYRDIEEYVFHALTESYANRDFPAKPTPRIIGDAMQEWVSEILKEYFNFSPDFKGTECFSRLALEDCSVKDGNDYHAFDVKTHCKNASFCAPNLVSIKKLYKFLNGHPENSFDIVMVDYTINDHHITIDKVTICPVSSIDWSCLRICNIGVGQLQLSDANVVVRNSSDEGWIKTFIDRVGKFYDNQQRMIVRRKKFFGL